MKGELKMDVNEYLPLRDVVFNTLRQAILTGEMEPGERQAWSKPYTYTRSNQKVRA